jgi:glycosyltransferase involved in cell wall biosynthesis
VLIHALGTSMGGAMRHLTNFLPRLGRWDMSRTYVVLVRASFPALDVAENIRLERVPDKACSSWGQRIASDVLALPCRLKREKFSAAVSLTNFGPIWAPVPHILFQRNSTYFCPYYLESISGRLRLEIATRRWLAVASMLRADLIVTPSQAMREMIQEVCPKTQSRNFVTLYHGFDHHSFEKALDPSYRTLIDRAPGARLFYPTHPAPHKGFDILFRALAELKQRGVAATLFTTIQHEDEPELIMEYERQVAELDIADRVVFMGRVPQKQIGALYEACDLMVYPSLCESFGFSMIEAMGHALPIVAAGTAINKELCAGGALYYEPLSVKEAADRIEEALLPNVRAHLIAGGKARVESFDWSWDRYAREFVSLVDNVLGSA